MADVQLLERSDSNQLPRNLKHETVEIADARGAWKMSDIDHADIIESSHDHSYLEYEEDLIDNFRDELVTETAWAHQDSSDEE